MKRAMTFVLVVCGYCSASLSAQGVQPAPTNDEMKYLRFMLMNVGSIDHSPDAKGRFEQGMAEQFGLNQAESAVIHALGQALNSTLSQLRTSARAVVAGKQTLTPADTTALSALVAQREALLATLAQQVLNSVRPETAARLRVPGHVLANMHNMDALKGGN